MTGNKERRTFIRVELPIECRVIRQDAVYDAKCLDLSATGMSLILKNGSLEVGDAIQVISDDEDDMPHIDAQAKVVRVIDQRSCKYGIKFEE
ncbi:MAG: PilZ domain-containing protein [Ruminobacter sp.]|jgi:c-di-GMP-binding flagellar brake protein YcgR|uniref:PilZ domain-containing protein n=1 Tax=Ruminobacter sp. TaxID=2774296 RepID=UPI001B434ED6|nr:PilZ domain-containing protein [Ruminobacter sp.]MBP3748795.1 PilZ domain-containing protein [Ruminobacter sp.]